MPDNTRFWTKVKIAGRNECWNWQGALITSGYGQLRWTKGSRIVAHRLAWELAFGPIPAGLLVLHTCDNRRCVNSKHLFLGTHKDNAQDMVATGRNSYTPFPRGERNPSNKLTKAQVVALRATYNTGKTTQRALAKKYNICQPTVCEIIGNQIWGWV